VDRFHRDYTLHAVLAARTLPVGRRELELKLECSRATVKRLVEDLRGYGAPGGGGTPPERRSATGDGLTS
jgi:hypothetical protein